MKKGMFSKLIVAFCVIEMAIIQFWAMRIASHNSFLTTSLLTANHAVFGGELLLLCLKKLLYDDNSGKLSKSKNKKSEQLNEQIEEQVVESEGDEKQ